MNKPKHEAKCEINMTPGWTCIRGVHADGPCALVPNKKPGFFSKFGNAVGEAIGTWFAGRQ